MLQFPLNITRNWVWKLYLFGCVGFLPQRGFVQQVAPVDAKTYAPFCAFASLIITQKGTPGVAQLSKALN